MHVPGLAGQLGATGNGAEVGAGGCPACRGF